MNNQVNNDIPDILLRTGASIPNQHSVVLTIYDNVTSIGMYFKAIKNTLYKDLLLRFAFPLVAIRCFISTIYSI